jgi:hypothetical protein
MPANEDAGNSGKTGRTFLCVVAIFKNESHIMEEWIRHYLQEGVDHFFLIDNGSTDGSYPVLNQLTERVTVFRDPQKNSQIILYNRHCLQPAKGFEWALVCDLDEFVYAKNGFKTIAEYLHQVPSETVQVTVPWKMFGSSGLNSTDLPSTENQPPLVVPYFTRRADYDKPPAFPKNLEGVQVSLLKDSAGNALKFSLNKSLVRTKMLKRIMIHCHSLHRVPAGSTVSSYLGKTGAERLHFKWFSMGLASEYVLQNSALNLNHYAIQSLDWYTRVKMTRGDVSDAAEDNSRDLATFLRYDRNSDDIVDEELAAKTKKTTK